MSSTRPVTFGSRQSGTGTYDLQFRGLMEEVAIYNFALTPAQILTHYSLAANRGPIFNQNPMTLADVNAGQNFSANIATKAFSVIMSSPPMQYAVLRRNFFVERLIPAGMAHRPSAAVMEHYRAVQPTPEARRGVAEMPKQILAAHPLLAKLAHEVPEKLGGKPALLVWGMKDVAFRPGPSIPRMRATFPDHVVVELPDAKHYIQEDAPERIAAAITERFG